MLIASAFSVAQPPVSGVIVSASLLKKHVYLLASDSLQGRETGTVGQLKAAFYCTRTFRQHHLSTVFRLDSTRFSYRQAFAFTATEVANFGSMRMSGGGASMAPSMYRHYELAALPVNAMDSSKVSFGDNVAGLLVGTDLKQEVVVLSAHYDHLGHSGSRVYHGADDNASGTATVLGMAALFDSLAQQGIRPRRSILFVLFSGEEAGLLGSQYFVTNSPIPIRQFVCDLNVDMVGRVDDAHRRKPDYCYLLTNEQGIELQKAAEAANRQSVNLALNQGGYDTKSDPLRFFYRSDQANFIRFGVPALFFTNGEHPDYHQPTDTAECINYEVLQKRATLIFQTAWSLANAAP